MTANSQPDQGNWTEYRACGDYSGRLRTLEPRVALHEAEYDAQSMTIADRTWTEMRVVTATHWGLVAYDEEKPS